MLISFYFSLFITDAFFRFSICLKIIFYFILTAFFTVIQQEKKVKDKERKTSSPMKKTTDKLSEFHFQFFFFSTHQGDSRKMCLLFLKPDCTMILSAIARLSQCTKNVAIEETTAVTVKVKKKMINQKKKLQKEEEILKQT